MKLPVVLFFVGAVELCAAGKILYLIPVPSKSHYILNEALVEELAERGHEVAVVAAFKMLKPLENVSEIVVPDISESLISKNLFTNTSAGILQIRHKISSLYFTSGETEILIEKTMTHQPIVDLLNSNQKFDMVIGSCVSVEGLLAGFAYRFEAPAVAVSMFTPFTNVYEMAGNPAPPSYIPDASLGYTDKMTFCQRLVNVLYTTTAQFMFHVFHVPRQDKLMKKYFGEGIPPLKELLSNISLVLVNHHHSLTFPRPYFPNIVEIGGYHVKPAKPLPKDLQTYMDEAEDGVIYFSMGSSLQSSEFPKETFEEIVRAFSKLKEKVLWKFEDENFPNLPKNVKISKWLPQSDILSHSNLKLFITHGGLLSLTESIFRGIPVVGIPMFPDQKVNVKQVENLEVGVKLEFDDISEETMLSAIEEVLDNPKYLRNAKLRSEILQDRPLPSIDLAMYWLEYVMRYKGAPHLKSGAQNLAWYQLYLIDVFLFLGVTLFVCLIVMGKLLCWISKILRTASNGGISLLKKIN